MANTPLQDAALGILIVFTALGGIAVGLRLWSRKIKRSALSIGAYRMALHRSAIEDHPLIDSTQMII